MKNRYEGLLVLNVKGNEDSAKEVIDRLEGELKKEGATIEQVQKIGARQFTYAAGALDGGYYVNFVFQGEPALLARLRAKFKNNAEIYRQTYMRLPAKPNPRPAPVKRPMPQPVAAE